MVAVAGSIESVSLGGREFPVAADADTSRKLGGTQNESQPNGNPTSRLIKTRVDWSVTGIMVQIDDSRGDQEFIQDLANSNGYFVFTITYASGLTWQGTGQIIDEFMAASQAGTAEVNVGGPGELTIQ